MAGVPIGPDAVHETGRWMGMHVHDAAPVLSQLSGNVPFETVERVSARQVYDVRPIGSNDIANLQSLSEDFVEVGVLRQPIDAKSFPVWAPRGMVG